MPSYGNSDSFVIKSCGLSIDVRFTKIKVGKFDVLNVRIIINEAITTSVDFTTEFILSNEGKADRILLSNIFNPKIVKQIMLDL